MFEHGVDIGCHTRQHDVRSLAVAHFTQVLQVVDTRRVDERYAAHTNDPHLGVIVHGRHDFLKLVGDTEEVGAVDFIHLHALGNDEVFLVHHSVSFFVGVNFVGNHLDLRRFGHAFHEEQAGNEQPHLDGNGEVEDDGEQEGDEEHSHVALRVLHDLQKGAPAAHVVRHHHEHASQTGHGDIGCERHEQQEDEQKHHGVHNAGHGSASAVVDVGHRTGYGTRARYAAEERCAQVGHALAYEFLVAVVMVAAHTVGHGGTQQRLNGTEHRNDHGCGQQAFEAFPRDTRHGEGRNDGFDFAKLVADGAHMQVAVGVHEVHAHRHQHNGQQRAGNFFAHLGREGYDDNAEHAHEGRYPVNGFKMLKVEHPLRQEVARHFPLNRQSEEVLDLCGENGDGNTARKAHHDGVRDELDDGAELARTEQNEEHAGHHRGNHQPRQSELGVTHNAVDNDDEGARRSANLHPASAQGRDDETADDGRQNALRRRHARGDAKGYGKRKGHNAHYQAGHEVGHQLLFVVVPDFTEQARGKCKWLHVCTIFRACKVTQKV